ncbi:MAG: FAD-dependent oxidoreductase [Myxococcaceae bacterium]
MSSIVKALVRAVVSWRLGPYRRPFNRVSSALPLRLRHPRSVAVVGGGIAGVAAASTLGQRGYAVTLFESLPELGGKLRSWPVKLGSGETEWVSHGFHAFFRHYYNLNRFLDSLGLRKPFAAVGDYRILQSEGPELSWGAMDTTPVLNLAWMAREGHYDWREAVRAPTRQGLGLFLEYDGATTHARLDQVSFETLARVARVPHRLMIAFRTFARAFFSDPDKLSAAELVKSFHFYFLSHDGGLVYDYPTSDYETSLWAPIRQHLQSLGVSLRLGRAVESIGQTGSDFEVDGDRFSAVVLATDVVGARKLVEKNPPLAAVAPQLAALRPSQGYAVVRLWTDTSSPTRLPVFVVTEREKIVDAIAFMDRIEDESARWVQRHGGGIVELHCYALPPGMPDDAVASEMKRELARFVPEFGAMSVKHEHTQVRRDFTAFHVGMDAHRPETESGIPGLYCAGDWVKLPFPAMLLEAAFSSGLMAANRILSREGLQEEPVECVPLRGLFAGIPHGPAHHKLMRDLHTHRLPP